MATFHEQFLESVKESTKNPTDFANIKQPLLHYTGKLYEEFSSQFSGRDWNVFRYFSEGQPFHQSRPHRGSLDLDY